MTPKTVAIIGAGRVGSSVGFLLQRAGYNVTAVAARTAATAEKAAAFIGGGEPLADVIKAASRAEIVFVTTPDRGIREACDTIATNGGLKRGSLVVHMSGAHSLELLNAARTAGSFRAVIHPLQSLASREQGIKNLPGSYFRIEADPEALKTAKEIVKALGGIELVMPKWSSDKDSAALYHAGAVAVSNYFVALVDYGLKFYQALGADKKDALKAVLPLIRGTLDNIETLGIPEALTGPIMRGDTQTVRDHLDAMHKRTPELMRLYKELARQTVSVARDKESITRETAEELLNVVNAECGIRNSE
jgi:predicted short-subunit dehydrogenase-like oxidoreductase (DUF2520 family)